MVWRRPGDKPLSEAMMSRLLTHVCGCKVVWLFDRRYHQRRASFRGKTGTNCLLITASNKRDTQLEVGITWPTWCRRYSQIQFLARLYCILIEMSLKFVHLGPIDNKLTLFRKCLAEQTTSHCLNQRWLNSPKNVSLGIIEFVSVVDGLTS